MKKPPAIVCLMALVIALNSSFQETDTYDCFITFWGRHGAEQTINAENATKTDWDQPVLKVEFRNGNHVVDLKGIFVAVPQTGSTRTFSFSSNAELTLCFKRELAPSKNGKLNRIILNALYDPQLKKHPNPRTYHL